jgi:hypothetical protein
MGRDTVYQRCGWTAVTACLRPADEVPRHPGMRYS